MGLVTFLGLVALCVMVAGAVAFITFLQKHLAKHDPKLL